MPPQIPLSSPAELAYLHSSLLLLSCSFLILQLNQINSIWEILRKQICPQTEENSLMASSFDELEQQDAFTSGRVWLGGADKPLAGF